MNTMWKSTQTLHPTFAGMNQCLREDWFLLPFELQLQRAHAVALHDVEVLTADELDAVGHALAALEDTYLGQPCPSSACEDLHTWVETQLTERAGGAGRKIHTARSRNDQVATLIKMYVIESGHAVVHALAQVVTRLCHRAHDWSTVVFPLQTHQQFAAPGTVGFWALRYASALHRIHRHLGQLVSNWREHCPLGSAAVGGSSIGIDRQVQATGLGFVGPSLNALESTSTRDECLEFLAVNAQIALHMQSFATDIIVYSQTPMRWIQYPMRFGTGSSMMPNKANPDAMELLRGESNATIAGHNHALMLMKGLPSGYNRDLQCIKPVMRDSVDATLRHLQLVEAFVEDLAFDMDTTFEALTLGHIDATLQMETQVRQGMPLRDAHHAVADALHGDPRPDATAVQTLANNYCTTGSASPEETRRVADELLSSLA